MKNQTLIHWVLFIAMLLVIEQLSGVNTVFGLSLIGPPRSILQPDESAIAIELGYSEMDLESFGDITAPTQGYCKYKIEKLKSINPSVRLDTNVYENWDIFLRLGLSDAICDISEEQAGGINGWELKDFDGDFGFSWGVGTRATFFKQDNITWGASFQANWFNPGDSDITGSNVNTGVAFSGNAEINYWEVQIAIGPTIEFENIRVYGGPFLHFVNGGLDVTGIMATEPLNTNMEFSNDIREESQLGGFLGAQWNLGNNNTLVTEVQFTGDAWGIGIGAAWKF